MTIRTDSRRVLVACALTAIAAVAAGAQSPRAQSGSAAELRQHQEIAIAIGPGGSSLAERLGTGLLVAVIVIGGLAWYGRRRAQREERDSGTT